MFKVTKGAEFMLQWPLTQNIVSESSVPEVHLQISSNPRASVTEKLDGSNVCVSTSGWIASRRQIIIEDINKVDLSKKKFAGLPLTSLKEVYLRLKEAGIEAAKELTVREVEVLLYGEWLQRGTATSYEDRFDYEIRGFKPGQLYAFGLGFHFGLDLEEQEKKDFEEKIRALLGWGSIQTQQPSRFFIVGFNEKLHEFLKSNNIQRVPYIKEDLVSSILTDKSLVYRLKRREVEGFVITAENFIAKWKFFEKGDKTSQLGAIAALKAHCTDFNQAEVIKSLEEVCLSSAPEGAVPKPRKKPTSKLFQDTLRSAVSKYPSLEDSLEELGPGSVKGLAEACSNYKETLEVEIIRDLVEAGYRLDAEYEKEIKGRVTGFVDALAKRWIARNLVSKRKSLVPAWADIELD